MTPVGSPAVSFVHVRAAVGGLVETAAGPAAVHAPRRPPALVGRGVEHLAIAGIHRHVDDAGVLVDELHLGPRRAAVGGLEHPALGVGTPQPPERRHVDGVGIHRIDNHAADVLRVAQAHVRPRAAAVARLVDAVAEGRALAVVRLAGADPDEIGSAGAERDVADRGDALAVEERRPRRARVGGLPHAARRGADEDGRRPPFVDRDVVDAPAHHRRSDGAPLELSKRRLVEALGRRGRQRRHHDAPAGEQAPRARRWDRVHGTPMSSLRSPTASVGHRVAVAPRVAARQPAARRRIDHHGGGAARHAERRGCG